MDERFARLAWALGLGGLLPFFACAALTVAGPEHWRGFAEGALIAYGAVILSFLGAVHWGIAMRAPVDEAWALPWRLGLGVLPSLVGWVAMLAFEVPALGLLAGGILVTAAVEQVASALRLLPGGYMRLRWTLSAGAALCLLSPLARAW